MGPSQVLSIATIPERKVLNSVTFVDDMRVELYAYTRYIYEALTPTERHE